MRNLARRFPFTTYYIIALLIAGAVVWVSETWGAHSPAADPLSYWHFALAHGMVLNAISIAAFGFTTGGPFVFLVFVFGAAPSISALCTSALAWGKPGLLRLLSRFRPWRRGVTARQGLRVYGVLLAIYLAFLAAFLWFNAIHGTAAQRTATWHAFGSNVFLGFIIAIVALFADEGGTFEELGWRGFALPYLQEKFRTPLVAAIVLGVLWWAWHLPRELPAILSGHAWLGGALNGKWLLGEFMFMSYTVVMSIVIAYCFNLTVGSVWPAIFIHGGSNAWSKTEAMRPLYDATKWPIDLREVILLVFAVLILVFVGPRLGLRADADGIDPTQPATPPAPA